MTDEHVERRDALIGAVWGIVIFGLPLALLILGGWLDD